MKAAYVERYADPEGPRVGQRPIPKPTARQVLIEVHAAGVNPRDWQLRDGKYAFRHLSGKLPVILGSDVSGVVVGRGGKVRDFEIGDEVFAMQTTFGRMGGYAEYIAVDAAVVARKPSSVSHIHAAAVPVAGMTAWRAMHDIARIRPGTKVVVVGASGGVGHYAVQFARSAGAVVTGVCGPTNVELVRALGAERVVDYTEERFNDILADQDVVFDTVGRESLARCAPVLADHGVYITTAPTLHAAADWLRTAVAPSWAAHRRSRLVLVRPRSRDLAAIADLMRAGRVRSVIGGVYPLEAAGEALRKSRSRRAQGKLVLQIRPE